MALQPGKIHAGGARIFVGVTAPATGTPPTLMTHTDGVPATGTEVGLTQGDTMFRYKAAKKAVEAEQSLAPVEAITITEMGEVEFTCLESVYAALQRAFDNVGTVSDGAKDLFYFGGGTGILAPRTEAVFLSSRQRNAPTKFHISVFYRCFSDSGIEMPYKRNGESVYKMKLIALADLARNAGDQLGQFFIEK